MGQRAWRPVVASCRVVAAYPQFLGLAGGLGRQAALIAAYGRVGVCSVRRSPACVGVVGPAKPVA